MFKCGKCGKNREEEKTCGCTTVQNSCQAPCSKNTKKISSDSVYYDGEEFCMINLPIGSSLSEVIKWIDTWMCTQDAFTVLNTNIGTGVGIYSGTNPVTGYEEFHTLGGSDSINVELTEDGIIFSVDNGWFTSNVTSLINNLLSSQDFCPIVDVGTGHINLFSGKNEAGENEFKTIKDSDSVKVTESDDTICFDVDIENVLEGLDLDLEANGTDLNLVLNGTVISSLDLCPIIEQCIVNNPTIICDIIDDNCGISMNTCNINAGEDMSISIPSSSLTLSGTTTSTGYTVWTKVSGGSATIDSPNALTTGVSNLEAGNYVFQLTMTDEEGNTCVDTVNVAVSVVNSNTYEIGIGNCDMFPTNWATVYTTANIPLMNGDVIYTDPALTVPYLGNNNTFRIRPGGRIVTNQQFSLTNGGVVTNELSCETSPAITALTSREEDDCWTYQCFEVFVPDGESRTVTVTKSGTGLYSTVYSGTCLGSTPVTNNITEVISDTKSYFINIAGGNTGGGSTVNTSVTLTVSGGPTTSSVTLSRTHSTPYIDCVE